MPGTVLPVLYVIACGAPPSGQLPEFVTFARAAGWDACVIATPDALEFLDAARLAELTGHPVRSRYKHPGEPDVLPPADALVVAPATFNTINKLAHGISDTLALGVLNEGLGGGLPVVAAPWLKTALRRHPAFRQSIKTLGEWGVKVILDPGPHFPWDQVRSSLAGLDQARRPADYRLASDAAESEGSR